MRWHFLLVICSLLLTNHGLNLVMNIQKLLLVSSSANYLHFRKLWDFCECHGSGSFIYFKQYKNTAHIISKKEFGRESQKYQKGLLEHVFFGHLKF